MKAAVCYEFNKPLVIEELTMRPPKADEVKPKKIQIKTVAK